MEGTVLVFLLCLQGVLLAGARDCVNKGKSQHADGHGVACISQEAKAQSAKLLLSALRTPSGSSWPASLIQSAPAQRVRRQLDSQKKKSKTTRTGTFSTSNITWNPEWLKASPTSSSKRQLEKLSAQPKVPNHHDHHRSTSPTGLFEYPSLLDRRQLTGSKKKSGKWKARIGSLSLLSNIQEAPLELSRVTRQVKRPGRYSPLGSQEPQPKKDQQAKKNNT